MPEVKVPASALELTRIIVRAAIRAGYVFYHRSVFGWLMEPHLAYYGMNTLTSSPTMATMTLGEPRCRS